jgi:lactosylceramide 4-alpha-galactosyltransferase
VIFQQASNGPYLVTRVMEKYCNTTVIKEMYKKGQCKNMTVIPRKFCFKISYSQNDTMKFFQPEHMQEVLDHLKISIITHLWGSVISKCEACKVKKDTVAALTYLARLHCPRTYEVAESF